MCLLFYAKIHITLFRNRPIARDVFKAYIFNWMLFIMRREINAHPSVWVRQFNIFKTLPSHRGMNTFLCFEWMVSHPAVFRQPQNVSLFAINYPLTFYSNLSQKGQTYLWQNFNYACPAFRYEKFAKNRLTLFNISNNHFREFSAQDSHFCNALTIIL